VLAALERFTIRGMAHITGGGLTENIPRILPPGLKAVIETRAWEVPPVFRCIQEIGGVAEAEMRRTFNMGIGFVLVVPEKEAGEVQAFLAAAGESAWIIGCVEAGEGRIEFR